MSHNPNPNVDTSGFNYPSAAGIPTRIDVIPTAAEFSWKGKLEDEHGGAGTRADDRQGLNVKNDGSTATPVAKEEH